MPESAPCICVKRIKGKANKQEFLFQYFFQTFCSYNRRDWNHQPGRFNFGCSFYRLFFRLISSYLKKIPLVQDRRPTQQWLPDFYSNLVLFWFHRLWCYLFSFSQHDQPDTRLLFQFVFCTSDCDHCFLQDFF